MPDRKRIFVTEAEWLAAVEAYELGTKHAVQIARELGVSPATVSREFSRRGCRKACRIAEFIAEFEAELDKNARLQARRREAEEAANAPAIAQRGAAIDELMEAMMTSIVAADRAGDLAAAGWAIEQVRDCMGVKFSRSALPSSRSGISRSSFSFSPFSLAK